MRLSVWDGSIGSQRGHEPLVRVRLGPRGRAAFPTFPKATKRREATKAAIPIRAKTKA